MEFHYHTNESLDAIIKGMDLKSTDRVLAICGSGEQAFAVLEHAGRVRAFDRESLQTDYAKMRKQTLADGDYEKFLQSEEDRYRTAAIHYFHKARMEAIQNKLQELSIETKSYDSILAERTQYDKIYLSNIFFGEKEIRESAGIIAVNGLVYIAEWSLPHELYDRSHPLKSIDHYFQRRGFPFRVEQDKSCLARQAEFEWAKFGGINFDPVVLKRLRIQQGL